MGLQPLDAVHPEDKPHLQGAEPAAQRQLPVLDGTDRLSGAAGGEAARCAPSGRRSPGGGGRSPSKFFPDGENLSVRPWPLLPQGDAVLRPDCAPWVLGHPPSAPESSPGSLAPSESSLTGPLGACERLLSTLCAPQLCPRLRPGLAGQVGTRRAAAQPDAAPAGTRAPKQQVANS